MLAQRRRQSTRRRRDRNGTCAISARPRESGDPAVLDCRLRGN